MCLVLLLQLKRKPVGQVYVWDAYLASTRLRCLFDKRLIGTLDWQVQDSEAYLASSRFSKPIRQMHCWEAYA